jgi:RimJ/RimL family protein N-acetyltransferase
MNFNRILLRSYHEKDIIEVLEWRNDISTRMWLRSRETISPIEHREWSLKRINNVKKFGPLFVFEIDTVLLGMTRLDLLNHSSYEVSILVNPTFRGIGVGKKLLELTCIQAFKIASVKSLVAYIHCLNIKSIRIFERSGFKKIDSEAEFHKYILLKTDQQQTTFM